MFLFTADRPIIRIKLESRVNDDWRRAFTLKAPFSRIMHFHCCINGPYIVFMFGRNDVIRDRRYYSIGS